MALSFHRACRCGHDRGAHAHYRRGTDCSGCSCASYKGGFSLTLTVRTRPAVLIVTPDVVHAAPGPYVRPTHAAGTGGRPSLPVPAHLVARPRRADDSVAPLGR